MPWIRLSALFLGAWLLSSCGGGVVDYPPLSFKEYQPIELAVSDIKIEEEYKSPRQAPYVEHLIPYSPAEAMRIWVKDRLRASGGSKQLRIIIKDGSVKATELSHGVTFSNIFSSAPDKRYDATLDVEMRVYGDDPIAESNIEIHVTRTVTMPENASVNQRQAVFRNMIADLMENANAQFEQNIYQYFGAYISYGQTP